MEVDDDDEDDEDDESDESDEEDDDEHMVDNLVPKINTVSLAPPVADALAVASAVASAVSTLAPPVADALAVASAVASAVSAPVADSSSVSAPIVDTFTVSDNHPPTDQPLMGSSRTFGGFSRGQSHGNVPNHADLPTSEFVRAIKGEVCLYVTDQYPRHINFEALKGESDMVAIVEVVDSISLVLEKVARKFAIIQSWSPCHFTFSSKLKFKIDPDYSIYYRKSTKWIALGNFKDAVEGDDECEWGVSGKTPEIHLLIVSIHLVFTFHQFI
jgi:hypothetical protein